MEKGKYFIETKVWKPAGKSKRMARVLEEREGYIDTENKIAYSFNNDYRDCFATDIDTGLIIYTCNGKSIDDCIEKYGKIIVETVNYVRSQYYYEGAIKLFEYLKTCTEPITEQKLKRMFV